MEQVLVLSDSHGLTEDLQKIKKRHPNVSYRIHCGDSELEKDHPAMHDFISVRGNCDHEQRFKEEQLILWNDLSLFVTHGHLFQVKRNLLPLSYKAEEVGANIVCFGHSHVAGTEQKDGIIYINPGSLKTPRGFKERTYVIISKSDDQQIKIQFHSLDGQLIQELTETYPLS